MATAEAIRLYSLDHGAGPPVLYFKKNKREGRGGCVAGSEEPATLDLRVVSLSTKLRLKIRKTF